MKHGLSSLGEKITNGAKWANENKDKIMGTLKPVLDIVRTVLEMSMPFFTLFKILANKIMNSSWFKALVGKDTNNGTPTNTYYNPGTNNAVGRNLERALNKGSTSYTKDDKGRAYLGGHLITSDYGWRTHPTGTGSASDGKQQFHKGIDVAFGKGEGIGAYVGGKVVFAGMGTNANGRNGYGNTVEILDDQGVLHKYHHGDSIPQAVLDAYKNGGSVSQGDIIMKAGATGYATGTHLDYETWKNGKTIHPLEYLASRADKEANEKALLQKKAEEEALKKAKEQSTEKAILQNVIQPTAQYLGNSGDISGTDNFAKMNTTSSLMTIGGR